MYIVIVQLKLSTLVRLRKCPTRYFVVLPSIRYYRECSEDIFGILFINENTKNRNCVVIHHHSKNELLKIIQRNAHYHDCKRSPHHVFSPFFMTFFIIHRAEGTATKVTRKINNWVHTTTVMPEESLREQCLRNRQTVRRPRSRRQYSSY